MFEDLNPMDKTTAVLEIVIMLLVAFLLGLLTMWLARKRNNLQPEEKKAEYSSEELENAESKVEELDTNLTALQVENEALKVQIEEQAAIKAQLNESNTRAEKLENKLAELTHKSKEIENELHEQEKLNYELQHKLKRPAPKFSSDKEAAEALGFKLAKKEDKEDLTIIKGVGPFIQEKLNELGIYTIEQISDFTIDTVIKVTEAIEYFPGRIQRDFWVEQANQILNERVKKTQAEKGEEL
jgi:predicted flap endonuclease-1-like 5' DNA nuclease